MYLTTIAVLLLIGIIITMICDKLKIPNIPFLLLCGLLLSHLSNPLDPSMPLVTFGPEFLSIIGFLALAIIVFDSTSHFKLKEVDSFSSKVLKLSIVFTSLTMIILPLFSRLFFPELGWLAVLLFSASMCGTCPSVILPMFGKSANKIIKSLEIESIINTPITVILPLLILEFKESPLFSADMIALFGKTIFLKIIIGLGTGLFLGIILLKLIKKNYAKSMGSVILLAIAIFSYVLSEALGGNGILAVTTLGLIFGNGFLKDKDAIYKTSSTFSISLEILVFVLIGFLIKLDTDYLFWIRAILLFMIYLVIRYLAVHITYFKGNETTKEKIFMALTAPKGIPAAVVAFALASVAIPNISLVLDLMIAFIMISIIVAAISTKLSAFFLAPEKIPEKSAEKIAKMTVNKIEEKIIEKASDKAANQVI
mgnify:CR=1 FL=1